MPTLSPPLTTPPFRFDKDGKLVGFSPTWQRWFSNQYEQVSGSSGSSSTTNIEGASAVHDFRLTLASRNPRYSPQPATPSSTNTTTAVVTFAAAPGWVSGTLATVSANNGGLVAGTIYYLHAITSTTYSFHSSVANALAGTSPLGLGTSITAQIRPSGVSNTQIFMTPFTGDTTRVFNGATWDTLTSGELSLAVGTVVSGSLYTLFEYSNSGTLALEKGSAWSGVNPGGLIPPDCSLQDGVPLKTGDSSRRCVGVFRADSTTTTIQDSGGLGPSLGGKGFLWNQMNRKPFPLRVVDQGSQAYALATMRQARGQPGNRVEYIQGAMEDPIDVFASLYGALGNGSAAFMTGIGIDATTAAQFDSIYQQFGGGGPALGGNAHAKWTGLPSLGYHAVNWLESCANANTVTIYYSAPPTIQSGLTAWVAM